MIAFSGFGATHRKLDDLSQNRQSNGGMSRLQCCTTPRFHLSPANLHDTTALIPASHRRRGFRFPMLPSDLPRADGARSGAGSSRCRHCAACGVCFACRLEAPGWCWVLDAMQHRPHQTASDQPTHANHGMVAQRSSFGALALAGMVDRLHDKFCSRSKGIRIEQLSLSAGSASRCCRLTHRATARNPVQNTLGGE